jgi:hypothetical protein
VVGAWARLIWNSAVVAAAAVAAQLGAADALGIIRWDAPSGDTRDWTALLTWVAFYYAVAVVGGALVGRLALRRVKGSDGVGAQITASLAAVAGASAVVGLAWLPAHNAHPPANVNPGLVVSLTAGAGILVGLVLALIAAFAAPVAVGLRITVAWLWLVAIGCAVAGLFSHQPYPVPRLGALDAPSLIGSSAWTESRLMIGAAAVVALGVAGVARWGGSGRLGVALSGFGGPAVVAASYLIAGPGSGADRPAQAEPYVAALIAAAAGLVLSVLIAMPGRRTAAPPEPVREFKVREPLTGDVFAPHARPATADPHARPSAADPHGRPGAADPRARPAIVDPPARPAWAADIGQTSAPYPSYSAAEHPGAPATGGRADPGPGTGWDADTWPGFLGGGDGRRDADWPGGAEEPAADEHGGRGGTYRGGAYAGGSYDSAPETGPSPVIGQPTDPHESWLRELGSSGRHAVDERRP